MYINLPSISKFLMGTNTTIAISVIGIISAINGKLNMINILNILFKNVSNKNN